MFLSVSTNVMGSQMCAATDSDSVGDDGLQCLRGDLQQASHPAGLGLTEDASHLKRLALEEKKNTYTSYKHWTCLILNLCSTNTDLI